MKNLNILKFASLLSCLIYIVSCTSSKEILFSGENWSFSHQSGNMVNSDSTLQFSLGNHVLNPNMTIISNSDSVLAYPGTDKYIYQILKTCGLENCKVYFFCPLEKVMWVELPTEYDDIKPRAIVCRLNEDKPYTSWCYDDDNIDKNRTSEEIYSNTFANKKLGTIVVVDKLNYGNIPMACLSIYQSATQQTSKLGFNPWYWTSKGNLLDYSYLDILANWVDSRRENLINNYKLGQSIEYRKNINAVKTELKEIIHLDQEPRKRIIAAWKEHPNDTLLHRKIGREIWVNDSLNLIRVREILDEYETLEFGEENEVLWAVIQHSNLELQKHYLPKFIDACQKNALRAELVAVMQDRILCWSGKPQLYGSQGRINEFGEFVPAEIEDVENVDVRRAEMGMCSLREYIDKMSNN